MADFYIDPATWGFVVEGGKIREVTDPIEEMKQRNAVAIKTHLGEVALDTTRGLPWTQEILVKSPNLDQITSRTRAYLLTVEGNTAVRRLDVEYDRATREMEWTLDVETFAGVTGPFNVKVTL